MTMLLLVKRCLLQVITMSFLPGPFWLDKLMSELRNRRPDNIRPKMKRSDRAKQFAPFAALGRMDEMLKVVEEQRDVGDPEHEALMTDLLEEDMDMLSAENLQDDIDLFEE